MMTNRPAVNQAFPHLNTSHEPHPIDVSGFGHLVQYLHDGLTQGTVSQVALEAFRELLGPALSSKTMQGIAFEKRYGYAGDFKMLDLIYQNHHNTEPAFYDWDVFFQNCGAVRAVRNRKNLFKHVMQQLEASSDQIMSVLNLASGPGRDVLEYLERVKHPRCRIHCVDQDQHALSYAETLCAPFQEYVQFIRSNAFRFKPSTTYRFIWSAGLFDYLNDDQFRFLLKRLLTMLDEEGEVIVGNFSPVNPSRAYMEVVGDWHLIHRNATQLVQLALDCGARKECVQILAEPEGINLFLHISSSERFLEIDAQFGKTIETM